jgi:hypothetical protein
VIYEMLAVWSLGVWMVYIYIIYDNVTFSPTLHAGLSIGRMHCDQIFILFLAFH